MTTVEALKALYVNLGGDEADFAGVNLNPEAVEKIAQLAEGGLGGEDIVFVTSAVGDASKYQLVKGSFEDLVEKAKAGKPISGKLVEEQTYNETNYPYPDLYHVHPLFEVDFYVGFDGVDLHFGYTIPAGAISNTITEIVGRNIVVGLSANGIENVETIVGRKQFS